MTRRNANFTNPVKRAAFLRSNGICECHRVRQLPTYGTGCGVALGDSNTFYEHIDCDWFDGGNDLDNCAVLCRTCWKLKTATYDLPTIAKVKRVRDRARGIKKQTSRPLPFGKNDNRKQKIGGQIVYRDSGKPVRMGR